jgi:hypothetical protein
MAAESGIFPGKSVGIVMKPDLTTAGLGSTQVRLKSLKRRLIRRSGHWTKSSFGGLAGLSLTFFGTGMQSESSGRSGLGDRLGSGCIKISTWFAGNKLSDDLTGKFDGAIMSPPDHVHRGWVNFELIGSSIFEMV